MKFWMKGEHLPHFTDNALKGPRPIKYFLFYYLNPLYNLQVPSMWNIKALRCVAMATDKVDCHGPLSKNGPIS